jgi:hypothetical protein
MALTTHWFDLGFIDGDAMPPCHSQHMREDFGHQTHSGRRGVVLIVSHGVWLLLYRMDREAQLPVRPVSCAWLPSCALPSLPPPRAQPRPFTG